MLNSVILLQLKIYYFLMLLFNVDTMIINYVANYMPQNQQSAILQASKHLTMDEYNTACTLSKIRATLGKANT